MSTRSQRHRPSVLRAGLIALALAGALSTLALPRIAAAHRADGSATPSYIECQHPVMTGVEVYKLHRITGHRACPVALALYRWEIGGDNELHLYGCRGVGHPYLKRHSFDGWHLRVDPDFVMSRGGASFAVGGTDFPINCS